MNPIPASTPIPTRGVDTASVASPARQAPGAAALLGASNVARADSGRVPLDDTAQRLRQHAPLGTKAEVRVWQAIVNTSSWPRRVELTVHSEIEPNPERASVVDSVEVWRNAKGQYLASPPPAAGPWPDSGHADCMDSLFDALLQQVARREAIVRAQGEFVARLQREAPMAATDVEAFREAVAKALERHGDPQAKVTWHRKAPPADQPLKQPWSADALLMAFAALQNAARPAAAPQAASAPVVLPGQSPARTAADQIRASLWNSDVGDLVPVLATRVDGWAPGRRLEVHGPDGLLFRSDDGGSGKPPVQIHLAHEHYAAICDGRILPVAASGNCCFEAIILAMGPRDAAAFGATHAQQWMALRDAVADYLEAHWDEFAPFLGTDG